MKQYEIVLATDVRESLLEIEREECRLLMQAIGDELRMRDARTANFPGGVWLRKEISGYYVDYRVFTDAEKKRFDAESGHLIVRITSVLKDL